MKKIYQFLLSAAMLMPDLFTAQAPPEIIHYNFNTTGTLVPNFASAPPVGTANGTIMAGLTQGVATGQCGFALSGTGTSGTTDYVNTNWTTNLSGSWSIAFWTSSITPSSTLWYILGDNSAGSFRCFTNGAAGANNWLLRATGMTDMIVNGGAVMAPTHNAFVYDAANSRGVWYLNGVQQGSVTQSPSATFIGTGPFKVGAYASNTNLNGLMDEFRIYSRALTASEVAQIAVGAPTSNTVNISSCGPYTSPSTNSVYATTGVYTETFTSCGGTSTNNINLTVNTVPTLTINASSSNVCSGTTVNITSTGNITTYTWNGTGPNTSSISVTPGSTTIYTLVAGNGGICNATRTININVSPTPSLGVSTSGNSICLGNSVNLTASGATTYLWNTGATTTTLTGAPQTNTTYVVTGTTGTCSISNTISITVSATPTVILSATSNTICNGQTSTLTATGAANFAWSTSALASSITVAPTTNTVYTVVGISGNCSDTKTIAITVDPTPTVSVLSSTNTICSNSLVTLTASGANSYSWSTGSQTNPTTITPLITGIYTVTGTTGNCSKNATVNINVVQGPVVTITPASATVCSGADLILNASGAFSYTWDANNTGNVFTSNPTANTTYTLIGKNPSSSCLGTATIAITVNPNPTVTANSNRPAICKGETAVITATGATTYSWTSSVVTTNTLLVNPTSTRVYTVTGSDPNGCFMKVTVTQTVNACIGIAEINGAASGLSIYPNPSAGLFNVELKDAAASLQVEIYNSTGQLLFNKEIKNASAAVDLTPFASGIYYLKISGDSKNEAIKLFKN